jgi:Mechanosensitive ion channel, conserved TM helix
MQDQPLISLRDIFSSIVAFIPTLVAGLLVLAVGVAAWWLVARLVGRLLILLRLDRLVARLGWGRALAKGDVRHALFDLVGTLLGALVFLIFLDNAFVIWHLSVLSRLLEGLVFLVPQLGVVAVILAVGWGAATVAGRGTRRNLFEAGVVRAGLIASLVRAAILVLASTIALVELNIAARIVSEAFLITFGTLGLSFVLAVGLGSRHAVEHMWEDIMSRRREQRRADVESDDAPAVYAATPTSPSSAASPAGDPGSAGRGAASP